MCLADYVALGAVTSFSMRVIVLCVLALHVVLLMGPPLTLTDLFNYLGYARLGGLHDLNPYTHVIQAESTTRSTASRRGTTREAHTGRCSPPGAISSLALPLATAYWTS